MTKAVIYGALLAGAMCLPSVANAADPSFMNPATLDNLPDNEFIELPAYVAITWDNQEVTIIDPIIEDEGTEWEEYYAEVFISIDGGDREPAYGYVMSIPYDPEFPELEPICYLDVDLWDFDFSECEYFQVIIPEGIVKNTEGAINQAQTITVTKSEYASAETYPGEPTVTPENGATFTLDTPCITVSFGGNPLTYIGGDSAIVADNWTTFANYAMYYNEAVSINADNELVINITHFEPGEYELYIPSYYVSIEADGQIYVNESLLLEYIIDEAVGVKVIGVSNSVKPVYNLQGVRVGTSNNLRALSPGIYVIDGKKVAL